MENEERGSRWEMREKNRQIDRQAQMAMFKQVFVYEENFRETEKERA